MDVCVFNSYAAVIVQRSFLFVSSICMLLLVGCGVSVAPATATSLPAVAMGPTAAEFDAALADDQATMLRIMGNPDEGLVGIAGTVWSSVPVSGQAIFRGVGVGEIAGTSQTDAVTLRGDVYMTVFFADDAITGGMQNIIAQDTAGTYAVDGGIVLSDGDIAPTQPNDFTVDYAGDLTIDDEIYAVDGTLDGLLRGVRFGVVKRSPIKALSATDVDGTATVNGEETNFSYTIVAETN